MTIRPTLSSLPPVVTRSHWVLSDRRANRDRPPNHDRRPNRLRSGNHSASRSLVRAHRTAVLPRRNSWRSLHLQPTWRPQAQIRTSSSDVPPYASLPRQYARSAPASLNLPSGARNPRQHCGKISRCPSLDHVEPLATLCEQPDQRRHRSRAAQAELAGTRSQHRAASFH